MSKAVRILLHIAAADEGVSAKHVAETLGLPIATTYHLLNTLQAERMVSKDADRRYHLGPMVGALADSFQRRPGPPEWLIAPLRRLASSTGETAYLSGWHHDEATVLATVEGSHAVRVHGLHTGFAGSAHARASGKVFLAFSSARLREQHLLRHPLDALTPNTITSLPALNVELSRIADQGYAVDLEEFTLGVRCVSAPVMSGGAAAYAYTVSVPSDRFDRERDSLIEAVVRAARDAQVGDGKVPA